MRKAFILLMSGMILLASCNQKENLCKETVKKFFNAVKNEDKEGMLKYYPKADQLLSYYKSDSIFIKEAVICDNGDYMVEVNNIFTNGFGKKFERDIKLYLKISEDKKSATIYDSEGMIGLNESKEYAYAKRKGFIENKHKSDQQISSATRSAMFLPYMDMQSIKSEIENGNLIDNFNWRTLYGGSAHGNMIVKNSTKYRLHNLKYIVHFSASNGGADITQEEGYVKVGDLMPGESTSASFYSSYVGNAHWARATLYIDEDDLFEAILEN